MSPGLTSENDESSASSGGGSPSNGGQSSSREVEKCGGGREVLLSWENFTIPIRDLVKSSIIYEKNIIEYYRFIYFCIFLIDLMVSRD